MLGQGFQHWPVQHDLCAHILRGGAAIIRCICILPGQERPSMSMEPDLAHAMPKALGPCCFSLPGAEQRSCVREAQPEVATVWRSYAQSSAEAGVPLG